MIRQAFMNNKRLCDHTLFMRSILVEDLVVVKAVTMIRRGTCGKHNSHVKRSHVKHPTSPRQTSNAPRSHVQRPTSHVKCPMAPRQTSHVPTSNVPRPTSPVASKPPQCVKLSEARFTRGVSTSGGYVMTSHDKRQQIQD